MWSIIFNLCGTTLNVLKSKDIRRGVTGSSPKETVY